MNSRVITRIKKRDGEIVDFTQDKITNAIFKAMKSQGIDDYSQAKTVSDIVTFVLEDKFGGYTVPSVEQIQDMVEHVLMKRGYLEVAKSYILYRERHKSIREAKQTGINLERLIRDYIDEHDWKIRENSNEGTLSFSGLNARISGEVLSNFALNQIYGEHIKKAHLEGDFHIHDLSYPIVGYCAGWSLENLLRKGFGHVPNQVHSSPAKHLETATLHMVNYIGTMQGEFAGAQAFSSVDTLLAPFVRADKLGFGQVRQDIQKLIYGLNVPSRWGWQTPFSNLTFDWTVPADLAPKKAIVGGREMDFTYGELQAEMDMINKAFLELMVDGDHQGRVFTFPIPTYNLTRDFNWDTPNARLLFDVTAKYGIPYFQNYIGTDMNPGDIRAMCCRLNLDQRELMRRPGNMWGPGDSTGSIGVVTINLNRIGYVSKTPEEYKARLRELMDMAKESLEVKREIVNSMLKRGIMPYTKVYLGHFNNHFSTIGVCGMHESCLNLLGKGIGSPEGRTFAVEILDYMRDVLKEYQNETGNLYNLEATPAESTSYRLARLDKQKFPQIVTSGTDKHPYLTNSTQLNVDATRDVFEALRHQETLQTLYTGGTIFHTFLPEAIDGETCRKLVRKISATRIPYFSITPTFSVCENHGYLKGAHPSCPDCGTETEVFSRIVGYLRPIRTWNDGKQAEFADRTPYTTIG
ncbi:MAG: ribonucleoside triphosphate reductase [Acidobacteriota bacterium]|jgi:anaerobic ribonucleoside-triphosphate reductase|nr:ribonucleoside triphosphate reductase [Acidobacteriota bacterium]HOF83848.1 ribonucleoside triphosphate reductase [Candidatus Aminicenantes bacterium]MDD8027950.1 ribonucleoside triphosphate reductase [Acidobacteriota bacterium]MDD8032239.1 ribonucleoside triphosphate reductase [Acidobacteriota bacterium]MDD8038333.1 ribonucleoside triphosphate reductase [Acidobacteriota bacterium]